MDQFVKISLFIHVLAGIGALFFGAIAIYLKNRTPQHRPIGRYYFYCMTIIFVTGVYLSLLHHKLFLFFISFFTYYACIIAYRILKIKDFQPKPIDWAVEIVAGTVNTGLLLFGFYTLFQTQSADAIIPMAFGLIGCSGVYNNIRNFNRPPRYPRFWLEKHVGNMLGSYIGAITAFTVNQAWKFQIPNVVAWLGPTVIIVPIIYFELKKLGPKPEKIG